MRTTGRAEARPRQRGHDVRDQGSRVAEDQGTGGAMSGREDDPGTAADNDRGPSRAARAAQNDLSEPVDPAVREVRPGSTNQAALVGQRARRINRIPRGRQITGSRRPGGNPRYLGSLARRWL
jgi:hypothetical protein